MKARHVVAALAVTGCLFSSGYVFGQRSRSSHDSFLDVMEAEAYITLAQSEHRAAGKASLNLATYYNAVAGDRQATTELLEHSGIEYYGGKYGAESAAQVTQAFGETQIRLSLLQAAQNQKIIELLQKIADKR